MTDKFDIVDLYKHYSKGILTERQNLDEKEIIRKFQPGEFKKFKAILYYDDDPNMLPASFQVDYIYSIVFNAKTIKDDFSDYELDFDKEINVDDDEIEKMIQKKMKGVQDKKVRSATVSMDHFYRDFFKKNLSSYLVANKLNDLIRAGVIPIENWKIYAVTYSTQVDENLLFRKIEDGIKRGKPQIDSLYGYQIAFESANKKQAYSLEQVMEFVKEFSKALETSLLKDTKYYKIIKK